LRVEGSAQSLALLYVDLDRFKPVNDTDRHPVADQVLQQFAQRLWSNVRPPMPSLGWEAASSPSR
jgi:diguanylate cyclase (GGDEF)-like protein